MAPIIDSLIMVDGQQAEQLNAAINSTVQQHVFDQVTT
jgi:hypothetical protein